MEVGCDVISADCSFFYRNQQVSCFGQRAVVGVDEDARMLNAVGICFARVRLKCADQIQVSARPEYVAIE